MARRTLIYLFLAVMTLLFIFGSSLAAFWVNYLWFQELNQLGVFWLTLWSRWGMGLVGGVVFAGALFVNGWIARGSIQRWPDNVIPYPYERYFLPRRLGWLLLAVSVFVGLLAGVSLATQWPTLQQFLHASTFGTPDPLFGRDIGFFVFRLPFYGLVLQSLNAALVLSFILTALLYVVGGSISMKEHRFSLHPQAKVHLSLLAAAFFFLKAWGYWLRRFELVYSPRGVAFGASYADVHAQLPGLNVLTVIAVLVGLILVVNIFARGLRFFYLGAAGLVAASLVLGSAYPALVQQFVVSPNERAKEKPFIEYNVAFTRQSYGLDRIEAEAFPVAEELTRTDIEANRTTIDNIRLWDWRPLKSVYQQLQTLRPYYSFDDVDIDRYQIGGRVRQVMVAAREIDYGRIPSPTWINVHLQYTHGYGLVMSPAAEISQEGLPAFLIRDIPPQSQGGPEVSRPEIYYGLQTTEYAVVKTDEQEFDYPSGSQNVFTTYEGTGGIPAGSALRRLAFSLFLDSYRFLFTGTINADSRVMIRRTLQERLPRIAPFLTYDRDPYLVLAGGRLFWIQDAYTTTNAYPYSEPVRDGNLNYIRNSVKGVVDAYNGDTTFYVVEDEPMVRTWSRIFPDLFRPLSAMSAELKQHLRYPEDLFRIQAQMYATYHMTDPLVFYNKEDLWEFPTEVFGREEVVMDPYYVIMQLPGEDQAEFLLMLPFTPKGKNVMIAWMAARAVPGQPGKLQVFNFPKQKTVFGPRQVESRIDQDSEISSQLTLWGQRGSQVIRGNLLVVPIADSLLYVEPLFLQATDSQLPELRRVIAAFGNRLVMANDLEGALAALFGERERVSEVEPEPQVPGEDRQLTVDQLIEQAARLYGQAQEALRQGNFADYGRFIDQLGDILTRLGHLTGTTTAPGDTGPESDQRKESGENS